MAMQQQSTIARRVSWTGIGLHGGESVEIALCPAEIDTGIVFVSLGAGEDGADVEIPARSENVLSTSRATTLSIDPIGTSARTELDRMPTVATVEHLLSAMADGQRFGWTSDLIMTRLATAIGAVAVFVTLQLRSKSPLLDMTLFANPAFSSGSRAQPAGRAKVNAADSSHGIRSPRTVRLLSKRAV